MNFVFYVYCKLLNGLINRCIGVFYIGLDIVKFMDIYIFMNFVLCLYFRLFNGYIYIYMSHLHGFR